MAFSCENTPSVTDPTGSSPAAMSRTATVATRKGNSFSQRFIRLCFAEHARR